MANEKRLHLLEQLTASGAADSFAWYGLALEYKSFGRIDDALGAFGRLRDKDPKYVPMYLMCGQMLAQAGRGQEARAWLSAGIEQARASGDAHAESELASALQGLTG